MKVLLVGGGTGGSVSPLLAVAQEIRAIKPHTSFLFVGTKKGPSMAMVADFGMPFISIPASKWRRYFSLYNLVDFFVFLFSAIASVRLINKFRPDVVFCTGAFVQVAPAWIARIYGSKIIVHQQDARIGLANKLVAPIASQITTAFEYTAKAFYSGSGLFRSKETSKTEWVGNPFRKELIEESSPDKNYFGLHDKLPVMLIVGGATGAAQINSVISACLPELLNIYQIIHQTGSGKTVALTHPDYHQYQLLPYAKYVDALKLSDIVIARAGMSTITELSVLGKISIIVPISGSQQEDNARVLKIVSAAVVLEGEEFNPTDLPRIITSLKFNVDRRNLLQKNIARLFPKDAADKVAKIILKNANKPLA